MTLTRDIKIKRIFSSKKFRVVGNDKLLLQLIKHSIKQFKKQETFIAEAKEEELHEFRTLLGFSD
ncbi:hypothetical protein JOC37_001357 [Desulfohalotomaculum tongense]|uniref:hypothetical protein n=1 Tax=Desulforadius tongensis TaxID=1216062 RepID=UPI00195A0821|nr:hypothetical protein [Desulforadius tongensis]MBM7854977.1 hypothetical protein [Desulforadius tongensis]